MLSNRRRARFQQYIPELKPEYTPNKKSILFGGVDEYISAAGAYTFSQITMSIWFKQTVAALQGLISKMDGALAGFGIFVNASSNQVVAFTQQLSTNVVVPWTADSNWHHFVATNSGSLLSARIDNGTPVTVATGITNVANPVLIGTLVLTFGFFIGNIDEVSLWNVALNATEIAELYNGGKPKSLDSHPKRANLVSWWRMGDVDTHPAVKDIVGGVNGTMINMEPTDIVEDVPT